LRSRSMAKLLPKLFERRAAPVADNRRPVRQSKISNEPAIDADGRQWPTLAAPRVDINRLEETIAKQSAELHFRCTQIADLCNIQHRQAEELQTACEEIDRLSGTVSLLLETASQHEAEAADSKRIILLLEKEKAWLREQLDKALEESGKLTRRLLAIETMANDRETAIASASEKIEMLKTELTAVAAEKFTLVAAIESERQRHRGEINQQRSDFEKRIKALESANLGQSTQIKVLQDERNGLAKRVGVLEAMLESEREATEFKIQELAEELQRERVDYTVASRASAAMRKEMTSLLPKLVAKAGQASAPDPDFHLPRNNAA